MCQATNGRLWLCANHFSPLSSVHVRVANLNSLKDRQRLLRSFSKLILQTGFLSPSPSSTFSRHFCHFLTTFFHILSLAQISRTKKFESFLNFALNNYQSPLYLFFIIIIHCAIVIVFITFICTCFLFLTVIQQFGYSAASVE